MAKADSKLLVIDASVAQAAGNARAVHPTAKNCNAFLIAVKDICHRVALPEDLREEWKTHQSGFARKWLTEMFGRKKVCRDPASPRDELKQKVLGLPLAADQTAAMKKDWLLIEAAFAADRSIVSLDDKARKAFQTAAVHVPELQSLVWVNPDGPTETPIHWLQGGALPEKGRTLGWLP